MIAHLVLLKPRAGLTSDDRGRALTILSSSARAIPHIRRFRIGRRIRHGLPGYEQNMTEDYEFLLEFEFDDVEGLKAYLQAPAHGVLGEMFATATSGALAYDYDMVEAADPSANRSGRPLS